MQIKHSTIKPLPAQETTLTYLKYFYFLKILAENYLKKFRTDRTDQCTVVVNLEKTTASPEMDERQPIIKQNRSKVTYNVNTSQQI